MSTEINLEKLYNRIHFNKDLFKIDKTENCSLYGFFQTEKYFKHIEKQIRNLPHL